MRKFAEFLKHHHLDELTVVNIRRIRELGVPLMERFAHVPEPELIAQSRIGMERFLDDLANGRALEAASEGLRRWEADELPGLSRDEVQPTDMVLVAAAQKNSLLKFLTRYTRDPEEMLDIVLELEDYYTRSQADAFKLFTRLREEAAARAAQAEKAAIQANAQRILDLNDDLTRQRYEAQKANRLKSEFLANMSHELRTPLNSILGYTELVLKSKSPAVDERSRANLQVVKRNGKHLLALINDVLDLAKIEAGRSSVFVEAIDVVAFFQGIASTADPLAREKGLTLALDLDPAPRSVVIDETKVRQIVFNLVSNAIKFTAEGGVTIRVRSEHESRWSVEVQDTGAGIAPEFQELVFEEFRQVDSSATRTAGGTGLGLAIARRLARLLGGDLGLTSTPGQGSTFRLELPREAAGERARSFSPRANTSEAAPLVGTGDRLPVVTIDDDPEMLHLIAERLKGTPYVAVPASSGESGLQLARELRPAAITLDIILPSKDGWAVLRELKSDPATADIPVLILSVADSEMQGYALGAAAYLTKPVDQHELMAMLDRLAGRSCFSGYVLVAEDDADTRRLYQETLAARGYRVVEAANGTECIEAASRERPALVILDLMMPGMDGFEVLAWLRGQAQCRDVPVVVVTARDLTAEDRARLAQAQTVICKGDFAPQRLVEELQSLVPAAEQEVRP